MEMAMLQVIQSWHNPVLDRIMVIVFNDFVGAKGLKTKLKVSECFRGTTGPNDFCTVKSILESARKHGLNHLNILKDLFSGKDISLSFSL